MIGVERIEAARERIADAILTTPCLPSPRLGDGFHLKCEILQRTGSFKSRGALNRLLTLDEAQRDKGVVAASAGNHAQGVAFAASRVGVTALIVMPELTPLVKVSQTRRWGAEVVLHGSTFEEAYQEARRLQEERDLTFVHPFDDEEVIAGQGTIGLEILEQTPDLEAVVVPVGGGGLASGIALAIKGKRPSVSVYGVQAETSPSMKRSLEAGAVTAVETRRSLAEGITVKQPGELTFGYLSELLDEVVLVGENEIEAAIFRLLEAEKLVAEGAGAATYAAALHGRLPQLTGRRTVLLLSGGNIDLNILGRLIERSLVHQHRLTRLRLTLPDRPGALAGALAIVAGTGANVLRIHHERFFSPAAFWETEVEVTLETRDEEHVRELVGELEAEGHTITRQGELELLPGPMLSRPRP